MVHEAEGKETQLEAMEFDIRNERENWSLISLSRQLQNLSR